MDELPDDVTIINFGFSDEYRKCTRKRKLDEHSAESVRLSLEKKYGEPYDKYLCEYCQHWHVGHSR